MMGMEDDPFRLSDGLFSGATLVSGRVNLLSSMFVSLDSPHCIMRQEEASARIPEYVYSINFQGGKRIN